MINDHIPDYECIQCKAINQHKFVYRNLSQYIVCTKCGHEALKQSVTQAPFEPIPNKIIY